MALDLKLARYDRTYSPGDVVRGEVIVSIPAGSQHNGISIAVEGQFQLQLSPKSTGLFEAFYSNLKPVTLLAYNKVLQPGSRLTMDQTRVPFEFPLHPSDGAALHDTYHGVYINVQYSIAVEVLRPLLAKNLRKLVEFIVVATPGKAPVSVPRPFCMTPENLENVRGSVAAVPRFTITGELHSTVCQLSQPFSGCLRVQQCSAAIRSIELQLVRVETCGTSEGVAREASEIQSIQIAAGDPHRCLDLPMFMVFPRLFTCPSVAMHSFKVDFEINLLVHFEDDRVITENFPIKLVR